MQALGHSGDVPEALVSVVAGARGGGGGWGGGGRRSTWTAERRTLLCWCAVVRPADMEKVLLIQRGFPWEASRKQKSVAQSNHRTVHSPRGVPAVTPCGAHKTPNSGLTGCACRYSSPPHGPTSCGMPPAAIHACAPSTGQQDA